MLQQDLGTQQDEQDAAEKFGAETIARAEHRADLHADGGGHEGDAADDSEGQRQIDGGQEAEGDADGQRVNAGGDGHEEHHAEGKRCVGLLLIGMEGLPYHTDTDDTQEKEGHPVIIRIDIFFKRAAEQIANQRHERLRPAKPQAAQEHMARPGLSDGQPFTDGHGKSVHGETDGQ